MSKESCDVVGCSVLRVDGPDKLTGKACYAGDIAFTGMLHLKLLRSDRPHAKILGIRIAEAQAHPGVVAVLTCRDIPGTNRIGREIRDQNVLSVDKVRFIGDPIALVAAKTPEAAEAAAALIRVDYEDLPGIFSPEEALAPGAAKIHPNGNLLMEQSLLRGDPDRALQGADVVVANTYRTPMVEHAYLEPEAGVARFDGGNLTVWMPSKYSHFDQRELAEAIGLSQGLVRVVNTTIGGCFGDKTSLSPGYYAALAALKTGRPAKMVYSREESFMATRKRHPFVIRYTTGASRDGRILAAKIEILADTGAYCASGPTVLVKSLIHAAGPYDIPNISMKVTFAYTNNPVGGSMRGLGVPQVAFAHESQVDIVALELGMDPFDIRVKNGFRPGSVTATGQKLGDSVSLVETLAAVRAEVERIGTPPSTAAKRYGWGVAAMFYGIGAGGRSNPGGARLEVDDAGVFTLFVGIGDVGQGSSTALVQIAAEVLRCRVEEIRLVSGDTERCPDSGVTAASRVTYIVGRSVQIAAEKMIGLLREAAASITGVAPGSLRLDGGFFLSSEDPSRRVSVAQAVAAARGEGIPLTAEGVFDPEFIALNPVTGQGAPMATYAFATQAALVAVDTGSGEVEVLSIVACHDVGRAVNPDGVTGQIEGGISMGVGFSLTEEILLEEGRIRNAGFSQYFLPTSLDMPETVALIAEAPEATGPFGAKGVGEPALLPTAPAIVNAIHAAAGVRVKELPATAEKVWRLLQESERP
ncbi:MAG: xanthine dehydrogenase family protein molybdopterin-binding subunit [Deltaproteobacteria bacterium]|nr:xanthine dehydrogenase family protein molybdopterin-binding subunit [Deltaproteobacteria bacterium]